MLSIQIPNKHIDNQDVNTSNRQFNKEVNVIIEDWLKQHQFTNNYGPGLLISDLRHLNVLEHKLQNELFYVHVCQLDGSSGRQNAPMYSHC